MPPARSRGFHASTSGAKQLVEIGGFSIAQTQHQELRRPTVLSLVAHTNTIDYTKTSQNYPDLIFGTNSLKRLLSTY